MIGPGCMPRLPARMWRKRTLAYTRPRRRRAPKSRSARPQVTNTEIVFDRGPWEFPIATVRAREPAAYAAALWWDFRRWLAERWAWLRPRSVPVLVAAVASVLVMLSADALSHDRGSQVKPPAHVTVQIGR